MQGKYTVFILICWWFYFLSYFSYRFFFVTFLVRLDLMFFLLRYFSSFLYCVVLALCWFDHICYSELSIWSMKIRRLVLLKGRNDNLLSPSAVMTSNTTDKLDTKATQGQIRMFRFNSHRGKSIATTGSTVSSAMVTFTHICRRQKDIREHKHYLDRENVCVKLLLRDNSVTCISYKHYISK